jgi:hypothetical protein
VALRVFITLGAEAEETEIVIGTTNNLGWVINYKNDRLRIFEDISMKIDILEELNLIRQSSMRYMT